MSLNQNDDWCPFTSRSRRRKTAADTFNFFLPVTGFLDTEIKPAIKPNPNNKGKNVDTKYQVNGWDLR